MRYFLLVCVLLAVDHIECQCTFPTNFTGTWVSSLDGTWTVDSTRILNYKAVSSTTGDAVSVTFSTLNFTCYENQGTQYALKSDPVVLFGNAPSDLYTCLDFSELSSSKLIYYKTTGKDTTDTGFRFTLNTAFANICNDASNKQTYSHHVALKSGSESLGTITCPSSLFGTYNYDTCNDSASTNTTLDVCDTRTQFIFNYTMCNTPQMFSVEGTLNCVHFNDSGSTTFLTLYNSDSTEPDGTSYYRYTCIAIQESGGTVLVTANPEKCNDNQDASTIASPGYAMQLTPYYLCPLTTDSAEATTEIWPIIVGVIAGLLLLALLILLIVCCCLRKRRKKKKKEDEEAPINEADAESGRSSRKSDSRRSSGSNEDRKSIDSGFGDPGTARTDSNVEGDQDDDDDKNNEKELVINSEGDKEVDDKTSRPQSGQLSRMSDLPPSTIPPDEDDQVTDRTEEDDQKHDEVKHESDGEPEKEDTEEEPKQESEKSDEETEKEETVVEPEREPTPEPEQVPLPVVQEEEEEVDENKEGEKKQDGENIDDSDQKADVDGNSSSDEEGRKFRQIGGKKGHDFAPAGPLTTVLVTREEDERKRNKIKGQSKKQRMKKLASKFSRKHGKKDGKHGGGDSDSEYEEVVGPDGTIIRRKISRKKRHKDGDGDAKLNRDGMLSDEERNRTGGERGAPFMEQYHNKKRIEHILDEQHYWSDPDDKDLFGVNDNMSSVFNSESSLHKDSDSEYEDVIGPDGAIIRRKVSHKKRHKGGEGRDTDSETESEYQRRRKMKRAGSLDSLASVEDPDNIDYRKSKRRLNEHSLKHNNNKDEIDLKDKNGENTTYADEDGVIDGQNKNDIAKSKIGKRGKGDSSTKMINVKERSNTDGQLARTDMYNGVEGAGTRHGRGRRYHGDVDDLSDFCDSDIDKLSDRDSGMDDEDEAVDVILNPQQQQMIVSMLFDEDMNLRPEFERDEDGRIIRRLDKSVIYDPHTGRFTFRKRLGQLFKIRRLKRNDKGRPTGGYIEDEYGPKADERRRPSTSSRKGHSHSGKSGRGLNTAGSSSSADLKRARGDGKNVGFLVPHDDVEPIPPDELDYHRRGRRDIGSAIRRALNKRLFKRKKRHGGPGTPGYGYGDPGIPGYLPEVQLRKSWNGDISDPNNSGTESIGGAGGVSPLIGRGGRSGTNYQGTPGQQRRTPGGNDPEQWQRYREGLQSDRKILDRLNAGGGGRPFEPREAFVDLEGESTTDNQLDIGDEDNTHYDANKPHYHRGFTWVTEDGRLVIRERNCPELQKKPVPLFTIIRRRGDLEKAEQQNMQPSQERTVKSAPLHVQDYNGDQAWPEQGIGYNYNSENSLIIAKSADGSQMTSIDDNRLRRLLEELYKDKKYLDRYVETTEPEPKSEAIIHSKGVAEHGRGYLLERADYWEQRGPMPPRPPMTEVGLKMKRQRTMWESRQTSDMGSTMMTMTPDISNTMPGVIESPRENENGHNDHDNVDNKENSFTENIESNA